MPDLSDDQLRALIDLTYDHACTRPVGELVDVERVMRAVDTLAEPDRVRRWHTRLWAPMRLRLLERASKSTVTMAAWLPQPAIDGLRARLSKPAYIPRSWIDEAVANERVRDAVRAMLSESISGFIAKASTALTENKSAGSGGLRGAIGWGARAAGSVLGGLGEEVQQRLQERARDFVDGAVGTVQARIAERLRSEETAKALGARRLKAFEKFLKTTEAEAVRGSARVPWADLDAVAPTVLAHNLARSEVRDAVRDELRAVLDALATETVGSLLDDAGLRETVREGLHQHALPGLRAFVRTPGFEAWWAAATASAPQAS